MKFMVLLLLIFLTISGSNATEVYQFSVNEGDVLQYRVESGTNSGTFNVVVTKVEISQTVALNIAPQTFYDIQGEITGEKAQTSMDDHSGWDKLIYTKGKNYTITIIQYSESLFLASYDDKYPLIWPTTTNFYQSWVEEYKNIKLLEDGNFVTLVEEIDSTPVDGCRCSTTIEIQNGITTRIMQNETYFFTPSGHPENKYREIRLLTQLVSQIKLGDNIQQTILLTFSLTIITITKRLRK